MHRIDYASRAEYVMPQLRAIEAALAKSSLGKDLLSLLKARASQLNGCAFCLHLHTEEGLKAGVSVEKLMLLPAVEESSFFTARERAAIAYAEHATRLSERGVPDAIYERLLAHFSEQEVVDLAIALGMINLWNRVSVTMRAPHPGREHRLADLARAGGDPAT